MNSVVWVTSGLPSPTLEEIFPFRNVLWSLLNFTANRIRADVNLECSQDVSYFDELTMCACVELRFVLYNVLYMLYSMLYIQYDG